jgi:hypothetical protein
MAMTDQQNVPHPSLEGITQDDIRNFVLEKVINHFCPACSTNNWALLGDQEHVLALMALRHNGAFSIPPPSMPVAAMACNNCGYIRSHALGAIALWKAAKK